MLRAVILTVTIIGLACLLQAQTPLTHFKAGPGQVPTGGGGPTTVFSVSLTSNDSGWAGATFVQTIDTSQLAAASGTQVRLTINFNTFNAGEVATSYFGRQAASGDPYDFSGDQVHILFSGGDITADGVTLVYTSDWVTLGTSYDHTKNYVFSAQMVGANTTDFKFVASGVTLNTTYYKNGVAEASVTNKSSYSTYNANSEELLSKIEIQ